MSDDWVKSFEPVSDWLGDDVLDSVVLSAEFSAAVLLTGTALVGD